MGTLNIKGFGPSPINGAPDKWLYINQVIREKRLAVLAVQEAHLTPERVLNLNNLFAASLLILGCPDPDNGSGARGIAFVISKRHLAGRECSVDVVIPGRAAVLRLPWGREKTISIANVYAPNAATENAAFWDQLNMVWSDPGRTKPNVILGDFNMVENAIDRIPERADASAATNAITSLLTSLRMHDSWREAHPTERAFTFRQTNSDSQSRLDRIYVDLSLRHAAADWDIDSPGPLSDHYLVSLSIANYHAPHVGPGRWTLPLSLLDEPEFMGTMHRMGLELRENLTNIHTRTDTVNAQTIFHSFKIKLADAARTRAKTWMPKLDRKIL
ncbi:DNase I-like protein, partial [Trametes versicolor FP-101664 SS1]|uniref:DNase I-like protein n=1 Tax=Trametes versicolor (strain FP-101664) TaxID=717944 RepID=UPI00046248BE